MIMPVDIDKKEFSRDKRGYNSREVDEFLDLIIVDYEKVLTDNRNMAHKIKFLEKQVSEAQKSDTAMLETLETAKRLMADISASAERRAELMMRDAELEAENMLLEAKTTVRKLNDEHLVLKNKVERLRANYQRMLKDELAALENDEYALLPDMDRSDIPDIEQELGPQAEEKEPVNQDTLVIRRKSDDTLSAPGQDGQGTDGQKKATVSDLSDSLKQIANEKTKIDDTIILK
ncbi:DivIVA domain-containing protein [Mobilibacterium timonense]|uniref:DivIVA domain-containing protein n=1 Tax=Mobilibacterium timonense TaxID=1871012 RepID=UPI0013563DA2|nr:DivIVA domain-containing protein [Mobilibacterium timonense]